MNVLILDYNSSPKTPVNRSQTGAFGLCFKPQTLRGKIIQKIKKKSISLPSLHTGYIAALLSENNHLVDYTQQLPTISYDIIILHATMPGHLEEIQALNTIKKKFNKTITIVWGTFPSCYPEIFIDSCDYLIKGGEPENGLKKLIHSNFKQDQQIISSVPVKDLNELPLPNWRPFSPKEFRFSPFLNNNIVIPYSLSRGCYFNCSYCHYMPNVGPKERRLHITQAIQQIKALSKIYHSKTFYFRDLVFTSDHEYINNFFTTLAQQNIQINWACETRSDCLNEKLIDFLFLHGLKHINIGIESNDPNLLKKSGRHAPQQSHQEHIISYAENKGISVASFYIIGFPDQTIDEIQKTIQYSYQLNTFGAQYCIYTPYPGTSTFKKEYEDIGWRDFTGFDPTIQKQKDHQKLKKIVDNSIFNYMFRWRWFLKHWRKLL